MSNIQLPHGAQLVPESQEILLPLGKMTLHLELDEIESLHECISDIMMVISNNSVEEIIQCGHCGNESSIVKFHPPGTEGNEYN